jgi:hypothetical protein
MHIFWVIGLLLALIDIPDFGQPLRRMAGSLEKLAGLPPGEGPGDEPAEDVPAVARSGEPVEVPTTITPYRMPKEQSHA